MCIGIYIYIYIYVLYRGAKVRNAYLANGHGLGAIVCNLVCHIVVQHLLAFFNGGMPTQHVISSTARYIMVIVLLRPPYRFTGFPVSAAKVVSTRGMI